jgi:hypothetical protein
MDSNIAGIIFVLVVIVIPIIVRRLTQKRQNVNQEAESNPEEISFWNIKEDTTNRLVLELESIGTVFTFDLDAGMITRSESQPREMPNPVELPISQVEKLLLSFEDAPTGIDPYAKLALITTQGKEVQIIRGYKYVEVVSPMAKKIADFIHKGIEEEILANRTFWKEAG